MEEEKEKEEEEPQKEDLRDFGDKKEVGEDAFFLKRFFFQHLFLDVV